VTRNPTLRERLQAIRAKSKPWIEYLPAAVGWNEVPQASGPYEDGPLPYMDHYHCSECNAGVGPVLKVDEDTGYDRSHWEMVWAHKDYGFDLLFCDDCYFGIITGRIKFPVTPERDLSLNIFSDCFQNSCSQPGRITEIRYRDDRQDERVHLCLKHLERVAARPEVDYVRTAVR